MNGEIVATLVVAFIYALIAIATQLGMLSGGFSLAPIGWAAIGAYATALSTTGWGMSAEVGLLCAVLIAAIGGPIVMLPVRRISGLYFALVSLSFVLVMQSIFGNTDYFGGALGIFGVPLATTLPKTLVVLCLVGAFAQWLSTGSRGMRIRAAGQDPVVARSLGVDVNTIHLAMGGITAMISVIAGYLYVGYVGYIDPAQFGFGLVVQILVMVVIGGRKSWFGAVLGSLLIISLPVLLRPLAEWRDIVNGALLIVVVVWFPGGLLDLVIRVKSRVFKLRDVNQGEPGTGLYESQSVMAGTSKGESHDS